MPSLVVAPASAYADPSSTVRGLSPRIVITGKTVSGGVLESSSTLSATIIPIKTRSCSIIDSSKRIVSLSTHIPSGLITLFPFTPSQSSSSSDLSSSGSGDKISRSAFLLSTSSSVDNDSNF